MTRDQITNLLRSLLSAFGGIAGGWFLAKGWLTAQDISFIAANSGAILGLLATLGAAVWGAISHRQVNMVATVAAMPEVKKIETVPTVAGAALADAAGAAAGAAGTVTAGS